MNTEETKGKRDKACCNGFTDIPGDFEKMAEMINSCCGSEDGATDCSAMGKKMTNAMMEMCCRQKNANTDSSHQGDTVSPGPKMT